MSELERRLIELGRELDYPPPPPAAAIVVAARASRARDRRRGTRLLAPGHRRPLAIALAVLLAAVGLAFAVPGSRAAILDWLGVRGVRIERVPELPAVAPVAESGDHSRTTATPQPAPVAPVAESGDDSRTTATPQPASPAVAAAPGAGLGLGESVRLDRAGERFGFPVRLPAALGPPDAVYVADLGGHPMVTLVYAPRPGLPESEETGVGLLLTQIRVEPDVVVAKKLAASATSVVEVAVGGRPGIWIEGAPHLVVPIAEGKPPSEGRLAGNTLLWDDGGVTYRLEADVALEPALEIARSLG